MKVFLFNLCFLAVTLARPDVSHLPIVHHHHNNEHLVGQYHIPSTNYGVPLVNNYGANVHHSSVPSHVFLPNYNEHSHYVSHGKDYGVHSHYPSQTSQVTYDRSANYPSQTSQVTYDRSADYPSQTSQVTYDRSADYGKDHYYSGEKVEEEKHVYFYSAPDVTENRPRLKVHIVPHHKKNTNVLYVKVPEYAAPIPEVDAPASHVDEKTKVYVLVKDAKEYAPVVFNAPAPVKTSHPELYVVPYKNEHDVEKAIAEDSHGHIHGAAVGHQFNDQSSFVKSINADTYYHENSKYSHVHPEGHLDYYARNAPAVPNTFVRYSSDQGQDHAVTSHSLGTHQVDTHNVHHEIPHHGSDQVKTHHVVTSLVPSTQVGTHSVHTLGGPVVESSGVQHTSRVSDGSVSISPLHSIVSSPAPGSSVSYSEHSITPGFGSNFVSSTVPTIHAN